MIFEGYDRKIEYGTPRGTAKARAGTTAKLEYLGVDFGRYDFVENQDLYHFKKRIDLIRTGVNFNSRGFRRGVNRCTHGLSKPWT